MLVVIYAGANGAGKSTLFSTLDKQLDLPFINPDMISQELFSSILDEESRFKNYAIPYAEQLKQTLIDNSEDFSFETVLSHISKIDFLKDVKNKGYEVYSVYIGTDDPKINVSRVEYRVANGGHPVPVDKTISRYYRSMENLVELLKVSDEAVILDNSTDKYIELIYKHENSFFLASDDPLPSWANTYIIEPLKEHNLIETPLSVLSVKPHESFTELVNKTTMSIAEWKKDFEKRKSDDTNLSSRKVFSDKDREFEK